MDSSAGSVVRAPLYAAFDGGPGSCVRARESAALFLNTLAAQTPAREAGAADQVLLVVSELVTNSVRHAPGPFVLILRAQPDGVRISVRDTSEVLPTPRTPDLVNGGGFGWPAIIQCLATDIDVVTHPGGKEIHAVLPW
ncbi:ATP-binding protein [Kitasatospora sp. NPDC057223]|uniref:ATP-binding protein n=1 Tax=Kitasatospora sp. NPDC057223 TaxID=3346055 RepID=UPI0036274668